MRELSEVRGRKQLKQSGSQWAETNKQPCLYITYIIDYNIIDIIIILIITTLQQLQTVKLQIKLETQLQ